MVIDMQSQAAASTIQYESVVIELYECNLPAVYLRTGKKLYRLLEIEKPHDWRGPLGLGLKYFRLIAVPKNSQETMDALIWLLEHRKFLDVRLHQIRWKPIHYVYDQHHALL